MRSFLLSIAIVVFSHSTFAGLVNPEAFNGLTVGSSARFDRDETIAGDDMTITWNGPVSDAAAQTYQDTMTANNPTTVASQTVEWFWINGYDPTTFTIEFDNPLPAGSVLYFNDFENIEKLTIQAFAGGIPVSMTGWTLSKSEGAGSPMSDATWDGINGVLEDATTSNTFDPLDMLTIDVAVDRLVYTIENSSGTHGFNFELTSVPEPTAVMYTMLLVLGLSSQRWRGIRPQSTRSLPEKSA